MTNVFAKAEFDKHGTCLLAEDAPEEGEVISLEIRRLTYAIAGYTKVAFTLSLMDSVGDIGLSSLRPRDLARLGQHLLDIAKVHMQVEL
jgi:hypothetical protein